MSSTEGTQESRGCRKEPQIAEDNFIIINNNNYHYYNLCNSKRAESAKSSPPEKLSLQNVPALTPRQTFPGLTNIVLFPLNAFFHPPAAKSELKTIKSGTRSSMPTRSGTVASCDSKFASGCGGNKGYTDF